MVSSRGALRGVSRDFPFEVEKHHQGIDIAESRMVECAGQSAHDLEAEALPEADSALIGADNEVELHRAEALCPREIERVEAHGARDAAAGCGGGGHIATIGDVGATAL